MGALRTIDATGMTAIPLADDAVAAGQVIDLPEWKSANGGDDCRWSASEDCDSKPGAEPGKFVVETSCLR